MACTSSYLAQTAACLVPALSLPSELADTASTTAHVAGAAASFVGTTTRADVFVGVRMNSPLSYRDLDASLEFYPPPTVYRVAGVIEVVRGQTVTLTIQVGRQLTAQLPSCISRVLTSPEHMQTICTLLQTSAVFTCIWALGTPSRTGPLAYRKYLSGFPYS